MEEENTFYNNNVEFENLNEYQRHSKKSKRARSTPERDEERFDHSRDNRKKSSKRRKERNRKDWN